MPSPHPSTHPGPATAPAVDGHALDNAYVIGHVGFVYTTTRAPQRATTRHCATLLLSADGRSFQVGAREQAPFDTAAAAVAPLIARRLQAHGVPLISLNLMPAHRHFAVFRALQRPGALALDHHAFSSWRPSLAALMEGSVPLHEVSATFDALLDEAARQLPPAPAHDPRADELIRLLEANPRLTMDDLAEHFGCSPAWMSRLFSTAVGLSLRDYQTWLKQRRMLARLYAADSLTQLALDAGFSDSSELSRAFVRWYGQSPSYSRNPRYVRVITPGGSNQA